MERDNRSIATRYRGLKKNFFSCIFLLLPILSVFSGCALGSGARTVMFIKNMTSQLEERKQFLIESAEMPFTENQEKLLNQLLQEEESLDMVLSSQLYLVYIAEQVGVAYMDYSSYLAAAPTAEHRLKTLSEVKEIYPVEATDEQIRICTDFYFKFRKQIVDEPDITTDTKKMEAFMEEHLVGLLIGVDSSETSLSEALQIAQVAAVPGAMAITDTDAFRSIWLKYLKTYGPREGLLRCAISTPDEFALMRSFFQDTAALEKWIMTPAKKE